VIDPMGIRWGLTGSFTSNGLEDVFGQCKIIDQQLLLFLIGSLVMGLR